MSEPLVTVLMSVYNSEKFLREAIESILSQTFTDFEFLIINDASTDRSREIILLYQDDRIRLVDNEENIGLTKSLNKGLAIAKGKYIARMDADDISMPERLEEQFRFMGENPNVAALGSWVYGIDDLGCINREFKMPETEERIFSALFFSNPLAHGSVMLNKEFVKDIGGYNPCFKRTQDYELWIRIAANGGRIVNIPLFLLKYRNHPESISNKSGEQQEFFAQRAVQNAYKLILNKKVSLKAIKLIRQLWLKGKTEFGFNEKIKILMILKSLNNGIHQKYHDTPDILKEVNEQIDYIYRTIFKTEYLIYFTNLLDSMGLLFRK